jgi:hypothetical protein
MCNGSCRWTGRGEDRLRLRTVRSGYADSSIERVTPYAAIRTSFLFIPLALLGGCATLAPLARLIQPPRFEQADDRPAEIRLLPPSFNAPVGGAGVRLWTKVSNPNPFGFTLSTLSTTLVLEDSEAATADFPLGLPLDAGQASVIPLDISISFADVPRLADTIRRAAGSGVVAYRLDGTVGIDAGRLGQPTFGPMMLMRGELRTSLSR